jgi:hypothetical protein
MNSLSVLTFIGPHPTQDNSFLEMAALKSTAAPPRHRINTTGCRKERLMENSRFATAP